MAVAVVAVAQDSGNVVKRMDGWTRIGIIVIPSKIESSERDAAKERRMIENYD